MSTNDAVREALLIANRRYEHAELRDLHAPTGDVDGLGAVLSDPAIGAFDVTSVLDQDIQDVHEQIARFFRQRHPPDELLLYITCHGMFIDGQLWFATPTTDMGLLDATTISSSFVWNQMEKSRAGSIVLILDCCHSGAFGGGFEPRGVGSDQGGRAIMMACDHLGYAIEDVRSEDGGSAFTTHIVEGLRTGKADLDEDGHVSVEELYSYVYDRMKESGGPLPKRKIDASGTLTLARSPRAPRQRESGENQTQTPGRRTQRLHHDGVCGVAFAGPQWLASVGEDATLRLWDVSAGLWESWRRSHDKRGRPSPRLLAVAASRGTGVLATAGWDGSARAWDLEGDERRPPVAHRGLRAIAVSPDGAWLATAGDNGKARIWPVGGGSAERGVNDTARLNGVSLSPDGNLLARAGHDHLVRVWDLRFPTKTPLHEFPHQDIVWDVAFSPDGNAVASASDDELAVIWDLSGRRRPIEHRFAVWRVAFSPDGTRLATAGNSRAVSVWEVAGLSRLCCLEHDAVVWSVAFSPDSTSLATASADGSISVWPL